MAEGWVGGYWGVGLCVCLGRGVAWCGVGVGVGERGMGEIVAHSFGLGLCAGGRWKLMVSFALNLMRDLELKKIIFYI